MRPLRFAYNSNGLKLHPVDEAIRLLASLGYDAIELALQDQHLHPLRARPADIRRVRAAIEGSGLAVVCGAGVPDALGPERFEPSLFHPDSSGRAVRLEYLRRSLEVAGELGSEVLVFCTGTLRPGRNATEAWAWLVEGARLVCEHAATLGVAVAVEPEPGHFVESLADYRRLRDAVAHPALGLTIDVGHLHCTEHGRPEVHLAQALRQERLLHVQIEDMRERRHEHLPFGEGEIQFEPVLGALIEGRYSGLVGVELSRHSERAAELARTSLAFLSEVATTAARIDT